MRLAECIRPKPPMTDNTIWITQPTDLEGVGSNGCEEGGCAAVIARGNARGRTPENDWDPTLRGHLNRLSSFFFVEKRGRAVGPRNATVVGAVSAA